MCSVAQRADREQTRPADPNKLLGLPTATYHRKVTATPELRNADQEQDWNLKASLLF